MIIVTGAPEVRHLQGALGNANRTNLGNALSPKNLFYQSNLAHRWRAKSCRYNRVYYKEGVLPARGPVLVKR